jgi:hypothetical protein
MPDDDYIIHFGDVTAVKDVTSNADVIANTDVTGRDISRVRDR